MVPVHFMTRWSRSTAAWEIKQHSSSDLSPKHLICTKCSTSCCHVLQRIGPNPCCKSAGKRRRKIFSSQVISSVELDDWKIILHAAWEIKQNSISDLSPKHLICTKCSTSCCHVLSRIGPNPCCKSAGKRRRKRCSSQVISSVELDDWKIILHTAWEIKQHSSSDLSPKHLICTKCSTSCCHVLSRIGPNPCCKSAGKRRRKRCSSQVISSVELDDWKIILHAAWEIKQHSSSDLSLSTSSAPHLHQMQHIMLSCSLQNWAKPMLQISREKKTKKIFITSDQLC